MTVVLIAVSGEVIEDWQCGQGPVVGGRLNGMTMRPLQFGQWKANSWFF